MFPNVASSTVTTSVQYIQYLNGIFVFYQATDSRPLRYSYTCNLCNLTSMDNERWKAHKASHGARTWKCRICELLVEDKTILANHLMTGHNVTPGTSGPRLMGYRYIVADTDDLCLDPDPT